MALLPILPIADGESLVSWVAHTGRFHCGLEPRAFLTFVNLSCKDVVAGETRVIASRTARPVCWKTTTLAAAE